MTETPLDPTQGVYRERTLCGGDGLLPDQHWRVDCEACLNWADRPHAESGAER